MDLKFIWIKKYNEILNDLNVNFNHSGRHKFQYDTKSLTLIENENPVLNFGKKITGVTAIAGQNGSGKSSICEIVLSTTATLANGAFGYNITFDGIVCYGDFIFYHETIQLKNLEELKNKGYSLLSFEKSPFENMPFDFKQDFVRGGFIYYSNVIDWRSDIYELNLANISTQALLSNDYHNGTNYKYYNIGGLPLSSTPQGDKITPMTAYYNCQGYRFTKFYIHFPDIIPFNAPEKFVLHSAYSGSNRWLNIQSIDYSNNRWSFEKLETAIFDKIYTKHIEITSDEFVDLKIEDLRAATICLYRFNLISSISIKKRSVPDINSTWQFIVEGNNAFELFEEVESINQLLKLHGQLIDKGTIDTSLRLLDYYSNSRGYEDWRFYVIKYVYIENTEESRNLLKEFMKLEEKIVQNNDHTNRRISDYSLLPDISSGEVSYYSLFSRIYDTVDKYELGVDERENLILFIDEAEIGFHPAWSKRLLKWLLDFLNANFGNYTFQIILTTHSPYLLSDLASTNIILLKKGIGRTEIVPSDTFKTFGANIHELLANNFFMKDGLIGDFAKENIQSVINKLNGWRNLKQQAPKIFF